MSSVLQPQNQTFRELHNRATFQRERTLTIGSVLVGACAIVAIIPNVAASGAPKAQQENRRQQVAAKLSLRACTVQQLSVEVTGDTLRTVFRVDEETLTLVATRHSLRSPDFRVLVQKTAYGPLVQVPAPPIRTYRGTIVERPGLVATVSFADGRLVASINTPTDVYTIEQVAGLGVDAPKEEYVVYRSSDMLADTQHRCAVDDSFRVQRGQDLSPPGTGTVAGTGFSVAEIAIDSDVEFFVKNGSDLSATVLDIETLLDAVSAVYERDVNITYEVTTIIVRTTEMDPYTSTDPFTLLCEFRTAWNTIPETFTQRDVTHLLTGKDLDGLSIGLAVTNTMCDPLGTVSPCPVFGGVGYALAESFFKPSFSARVAISAHELGHTWNAQHCDGSGGACHIMCSANLGTLVPGNCGFVEGDNLNFSAGPVAAITAFRNAAACLDTQGTALALPFIDDFIADTPDPTLWTFVDGAEVTDLGSNEPSAPFALTLNAAGAQEFRDDEIRSNFILLGQGGTLSFAFHTQHMGVPSGGTLDIDYRADNLTWQPLDQIVSDGVDQSAFVSHIHELPADAMHDGFRIRFRVDVDDPSARWFVDNVRVFEGCATDVQCDDGVECTIDTCNPSTGACTNAPDNSFCDDLTFCTGGATCDTIAGCVDAPAPCADGLFCRETPLPHCVVCLNDAQCDDGVDCTIDTCNPSTGVCTNAPDNSFCDDLTFCTGGATCDTVAGCLAAPPPCAEGFFCRESPLPHCVMCDNDANCDDGLFCNGAETCVDGECVTGDAPCTLPEVCNEPLERCIDPTCAAPTITSISPRYLAITPPGGTDPINLLITPGCDPGVTLYVGAPFGPDNIAFVTTSPGSAALLTPDEWGPTVRVTGDAVVPVTTYLAFTNCGTETTPAFSVWDDAETEKWGDVAGFFTDGMWEPPNKDTAIVDVVAILDGFQNLPVAPPVFRTDLIGLDAQGPTCSTDQTISISDLTSALDAFTGLSFAATTGCAVPCP